MATAIDSYVFIDIFLHSDKEDAAVKRLQHAMKGGIVLSTMALLEVKYTVMRRLGHEKAEEAVFAMKNLENAEIVPVDSGIAEAAADIREKYYRNKEREISFADSLHIATALSCKCESIVSGDPDFEGIEGIKTDVY